MPPGNEVGMGLTKGGVVGVAASFGGGVVAGDDDLLLIGDRLLDLSLD